jgi:hypothetical protein
MGAGVEIYTDTEVLQLGKDLDAAFLSEPRSASEVNSGNVGNWQGVFKILQTSGATLERAYADTWNFTKLSNYSSDSRWFKILHRVNTGGLTSVNSGIEIYNSNGDIEYNSSYDPIKAIDIVEGNYYHDGINSGIYPVFKKQYGKPVMVLIDRQYRVSGKLKIIADASGRFELDFDFNNRDSRVSNDFNYKFIVLDATSVS